MLCLLKLCFWPRAKTLLLRGIRKCSAARWPTGSIRALLSATRHSCMLQHHQPNSSSFGSFQDLLYRRFLQLLRRHIHLPPLQRLNTDRQLVQTTHLLLQYLRVSLIGAIQPAGICTLVHFANHNPKWGFIYRGLSDRIPRKMKQRPSVLNGTMW